MQLSILVHLFQLAGIEIIKLERLRNEYWPDRPDYREVIQGSPWWLVEIDIGVLKIGWRKRVIVIDWSSTGYKFGRDEVTDENVTKSETMVHAWGYSDAIRLLQRIQSLHYPVTNERANYCDHVFGRAITTRASN